MRIVGMHHLQSTEYVYGKDSANGETIKYYFILNESLCKEEKKSIYQNIMHFIRFIVMLPQTFLIRYLIFKKDRSISHYFFSSSGFGSFGIICSIQLRIFSITDILSLFLLFHNHHGLGGGCFCIGVSVVDRDR